MPRVPRSVQLGTQAVSFWNSKHRGVDKTQVVNKHHLDKSGRDRDSQALGLLHQKPEQRPKGSRGESHGITGKKVPERERKGRPWVSQERGGPLGDEAAQGQAF